MAGDVEVTGVAHTIRRLHVVKGETATGMERALVIAGITIQRLSQKVVPVDTGFLKGSAFTAAEGHGFSTKVQVGYTAPYAIFVHENLDAWHAQGKIAKYLERPIRENRNLIETMIRDEAQLGNKRAIPQLAPPASFESHAALPVMPRGPGSYVQQVGGKKVTYERGFGWREGREMSS